MRTLPENTEHNTWHWDFLPHSRARVLRHLWLQKNTEQQRSFCLSHTICTHGSTTSRTECAHTSQKPRTAAETTGCVKLTAAVSGKKHGVNERQRARVSRAMTHDWLQHDSAPSLFTECRGFLRKDLPTLLVPPHTHCIPSPTSPHSVFIISTCAFSSSLPETNTCSRWRWQTWLQQVSSLWAALIRN